MATRIFLSWAHQDEALTRPLVNKLLEVLGLFTDLDVEWWEDSHLTCGEDLRPGIVDRISEADYGLLLLSPTYFSRPFIRTHELPRFVGPTADRKALPVLLTPLPGMGPEWDLGGVPQKVIFTLDGRSFAECTGVRRTRFVNALASSIRRRVIDLNAYRPL